MRLEVGIYQIQGEGREKAATCQEGPGPPRSREETRVAWPGVSKRRLMGHIHLAPVLCSPRAKNGLHTFKSLQTVRDYFTDMNCGVHTEAVCER